MGLFPFYASGLNYDSTAPNLMAPALGISSWVVPHLESDDAEIWIKSVQWPNRIYTDPVPLIIHDNWSYRESYATFDCITGPVEIPNGDTCKIYPTANLLFSDGGKFIVPEGAVLQFVGRGEYEDTLLIDPTGVSAYFEGDTTAPPKCEAIEVQPGGKVIGKHAKFAYLPVAISAMNGGVISLDSMEFRDCATAMNLGGLDHVSVTNSQFINGNTGVWAKDGIAEQCLTLQNCTFESQQQRSLDLAFLSNVLIDHVSINGNPEAEGIYLETCDWTVSISNSAIRNCYVGVQSVCSNARFYGDTVSNNISAGFYWSNNHPDSKVGRIDGCIITGNGSNGNPGGFAGYACDPILTCNLIADNSDYAVHLEGNAAPSFYDHENEEVGGNVLSGQEGFPVVFMKDAAPIFMKGQNLLRLPPNEDGFYMEDASGDPLTHNLSDNRFEQGTDMKYFIPPDPKIWVIEGESGDGVCAGELGEILLMGDGLLIRGDLLASANLVDSAMIYYEEALTTSGDTTAAGAAALARLAKHDPSLPPVGEPLVVTSMYNASYGFDAVRDFDSADAFRDSILANGTAFDSLRIAYDMEVSALLRNTRRGSSQDDASTRLEAERKRRDLFELLVVSGARRQPSDPGSALPARYALSPAFPNPFNALTTIRYYLPEASRVTLDVYNITGQRVATLTEGFESSGYHVVHWNASTVASGVYIYQIKAGSFVDSKKMVLIR